MPNGDGVGSVQRLRDYVSPPRRQPDASLPQLKRDLLIYLIYWMRVPRCRVRDYRNVEIYVATVGQSLPTADASTPNYNTS